MEHAKYYQKKINEISYYFNIITILQPVPLQKGKYVIFLIQIYLKLLVFFQSVTYYSNVLNLKILKAFYDYGGQLINVFSCTRS